MKSDVGTTYNLDDLVKGLGLDFVQPASKRFAANAPRTVLPQRTLPPEMDVVCKDSERTEHLTRLAGKLYSNGLQPDVVEQLAHSWNSRNTPPMEAEKVTSTCEGIWKTHQRNHPESANPEGSGELTPLFPIAEARIERFISNPPPARRWLLKECLPLGKVGALIAPGGTGKSQFLLQLAVSVATGTEFFGWEIGEPGGVLCLFAEDDDEEIHRRLYRIAFDTGLRHDIALEAQMKLLTNLHVKSMVAKDNLMTVTDRASGEVIPTNYAERLLLVTREIPDLKLIVIDPGSRFRGGDENLAQDTTRFVEALERVSRSTGANLLVAHHANKGAMSGGEQTQASQRGSSALSDGVRWQMNLSALNKPDAKELRIAEERRHFYLVADVVKNNYGPPSEAILLERRDGGYLEKVDPGLVSRAADIGLLNQVKQLLRTEEEGGRQYSRTAFEEKFGGVDKQFKIGMNDLRDRLSRWVSEGQLFLDKKKNLKADSPIASGYLPLSDKTTDKSKS